jgi:hypothetical protein
VSQSPKKPLGNYQWLYAAELPRRRPHAAPPERGEGRAQNPPFASKKHFYPHSSVTHCFLGEVLQMPMSASTNQQIQIGDDLWSGARAVDRRDAALQRLLQHQRDAVELP